MHHRRHITRITIATLIVVGLVAPAAPARAETSAQLAAQLRALNAQVQKAGKTVDDAEHALEDTEYALRQNGRQAAKTSRDLARARKRLRGRAADIYRMGATDTLSMLFEAKSLDDLLTRMSYAEAIAGQDAGTVAEVKELSANLKAQKTALRDNRARQTRILAGRAARVEALQAQVRGKQAEYARLRARLAAAAAAEMAAGHKPASSVVRGANGMVFPVAGPNYYADTFGAPRSGGRSHKGTDIMAATGVPVVAITDGDVSSKEGGLGGKVIWLRGSGWSFYYAHLDGWKVRSGRVKAGEVIGWVGATGNAAGGPPHLHFEMHPGGGGAVNPYPYLRGMD